MATCGGVQGLVEPKFVDGVRCKIIGSIWQWIVDSLANDESMDF